MARCNVKKKLGEEEAKELVNKLLGCNVDVRLNRGRNKIKHYRGVLAEAHSNVFVIKLADDIFDRISCSYVDLICGELVIRPRA